MRPRRRVPPPRVSDCRRIPVQMRVITRVPLERSNFTTRGKPRLALRKNDHPDGLAERRNN
jgi:hypothetical protein